MTASACIERIDIVVRVRCRCKESSRSLSHLLMYLGIRANSNLISVR